MTLAGSSPAGIRTLVGIEDDSSRRNGIWEMSACGSEGRVPSAAAIIIASAFAAGGATRSIHVVLAERAPQKKAIWVMELFVPGPGLSRARIVSRTSA